MGPKHADKSKRIDRARREHVYAVIRLDLFVKDPAEIVTVKEVLPSREEALAEAQRLNALRRAERKHERIVYIVQMTRYFLEGLGRKISEKT